MKLRHKEMLTLAIIRREGPIDARVLRAKLASLGVSLWQATFYFMMMRLNAEYLVDHYDVWRVIDGIAFKVRRYHVGPKLSEIDLTSYIFE